MFWTISTCILGCIWNQPKRDYKIHIFKAHFYCLHILKTFLSETDSESEHTLIKYTTDKSENKIYFIKKKSITFFGLVQLSRAIRNGFHIQYIHLVNTWLRSLLQAWTSLDTDSILNRIFPHRYNRGQRLAFNVDLIQSFPW